MNAVYKILTIVGILGACAFARTSNSFNSLDSFFEQYQSSTKPVFQENRSEDGSDSLKWKRRHKRRKKSKNRKPHRGR